MNMKKICIIILFLSVFRALPAQEIGKDTVTAVSAAHKYTDEFLDTVKISRKVLINDYSMIGFQYGPAISQVIFNPTKKQGMVLNPVNFGVTYTRYGKMFGYMPHFGFQTGLFYGQSGYRFKKDKETGEYESTVDGATSATYSYIEIPALAQIHIDVWHLKLMLHGGLFGAYKIDVEREGDVAAEYVNSFYDYERRFEYGFKAGAGFGLFFDPIEIHIQGTFRYALGSLYKPDYYSQYYYRFAHPADIIISAGVFYQITRRTGKTRAMLRKEARKYIYEPETENADSENR